MTTPPSQTNELSDQLRQLLHIFDVTAKAILPTSSRELLQSIVDAAARIFGAAAASIALVDERQGVLRFEVVYGEGQGDVLGLEMSLDQGIAGYVVMTGNPIAVADVKKDPRFAEDFAQKTGYIPNSILAMPLIWNDRVIGVMEVLDKIDSPSFGMQDMELLGMFARQAAIAIYQSQHYDRIGDALLDGIKELSREFPNIEFSEILDVLSQKSSDDKHASDLIELAELVFAISELGEAERQLCLRILDGFREYTKSMQFSL
jgi:GAF domain-containing protein